MSNVSPSTILIDKARKRDAFKKFFSRPGNQSDLGVATSLNRITTNSSSISSSSPSASTIGVPSPNGTAPVISQASSRRPSISSQPTRDATLWEQAVKKVPLPERNVIDFNNPDKLLVLKKAREAAVQSQELCVTKQWKVTWNGKDVVLREVAGKLIAFIDKFAQIGDLVVQYDPMHAALPWAGFRLLLQLAVADAENMGLALLGLEKAAQCINRCTIYESLYLKRQITTVSDAMLEHKRRIIDLYAAILMFQASAITFYHSNSAGRGIKAVFEMKKLQAQLSAIDEKELDVQNSVGLVDKEDQMSFNHEHSENQKKLRLLLEALDTTIVTELRGFTIKLTSIEQNMGSTERDRQFAKQDYYLAKLPRAQGAAFNSYKNEERTQCLEDTRAELLSSIEQWRCDSNAPCIYWLSGMAGTGKSTIAKTVAHTCFEQNCLGASFFFTRGEGDLSNATKLFTSIAFQLANTIPDLKPHVSQAIATNPSIIDGNLHDQWKFLILQPISLLRHQPTTPQAQVVLVIDALDECEREWDINLIIKLLSEAASVNTLQFRVFLTSRPELPIRLGFNEVVKTEHQDVVLHDVEHSIIERDISIYFKFEFSKIRKKHPSLPHEWPGDEVIKGLVQQANKLFIYAATASLFIGDPKWSPKERLSLLLEGSDLPGSELDDMYIRVLQDSVFGNCPARQKAALAARFRDIIGPIVVLFDALNIITLSKLLGKDVEVVSAALGPVHSVLHIPAEHIPTEQGAPIRLIHLSFHDFLLDAQRCTEQQFWIDEKKQHFHMFQRCLAVLAKALKQDICHLKMPGTLTSDVPEDIVNQYISMDTRYASLYWVKHLEQSGLAATFQDNDRLHTFLQEHLLHWLETLSLIKHLPESIHMIITLDSLASLHDAPNLRMMVKDINRFILSTRHIIERAPLQIYASALVFSPFQSIVRHIFSRQIVLWIRVPPLVHKNWSNSLQTLEGHSHRVRAVAFSPDGKVLASASWDKTIKLWDPATGVLRDTLEHAARVIAIAFSPDGKVLASASDDRTVKLWDPVTGVLRDTLTPSARVVAVAFSPDGNVLASASDDEMVELWDPATGVLRDTLKHSAKVTAVTFSPDGNVVASASNDRTVKLWDLTTAVLQNTLKHLGWVMAVAFSPDGKILASASYDRTVKLWDPVTGVLRNTLKHSGWVMAVAFSPDGKVLASASYDRTVKLWDPATGVLRDTLKHSAEVIAVAFSPDGRILASASDDKTVKLWDPATEAISDTLEHTDKVVAVVFAPDGKVLASASYDRTVKLWDSATGVLRNTLEHSEWVVAVAFSPDSRILASASYDKTVKLWDPATGVLRDTLKHSAKVTAVTFSPDGNVIASASWDKTVKLWDSMTGVLRNTLEHSEWVSAVAFSPDGNAIASASWDKTVKLWDPATGVLRDKLVHSDQVSAVTFSPDGLHLEINLDTLLRLKHPVAARQQSDFSRPYDISEDREWVTWRGQNLFWLHPEYRPTPGSVHATTGNMLALGSASGRVTFIEIDPDVADVCLNT